MLVSFSVKNYKSFKDEIILNFENTHDYKYNSRCIKNGLLSKVVIYGANASGKSNFGFALFDIVSLLTDKNTHHLQNDEISFINADSDSNIAEFKYIFKNKKDIIIYSYKKKSPKVMTYEELFVNDKLIYSYDFENKKFNDLNLKDIYAESLNFEYFENNFAILRYIANNTNQPDNSIVKFVMNFVSHMLWFRSLQENGYIGLTTGGESLSQWIANNNLAKELAFPIDVSQDIYSSDCIPFADRGVPAINFMRFGVGNSAHIHDRYDTMYFISADALDKTYQFVKEFSLRLQNYKVFPIEKEIPENIVKRVDEYLFKKEDNKK